ncbi:MAG TPA: class F sortase [Candidatus Saccharimonadales bacterium]|nr:class F sortase [Candidatus Saccharimonadales bacterium]
MTWRAKQYHLRITPSKEFLLTLRRFNTPKARRSKQYKQLVVTLPAGSVKELALRIKPVPRPRSIRQKTGWQKVLEYQVTLSIVMVLFGLTGAVYFGMQIYAGHKIEPVKTFSSTTPVPLAAKALPASVPTHISAPSVGIDASVMTVGRDSDGSIQMPPLFDWTTGWYKYSPSPGQVGPSVIVGHVDTYKGISVFWRLRDLQRGDIIDVTRADGRTVKFKVTALKQFNQNNFPTQEVYGNIQYPGLRLITCGGSFDQQTESYTQNTVVYAFMVS